MAIGNRNDDLVVHIRGDVTDLDRSREAAKRSIGLFQRDMSAALDKVDRDLARQGRSFTSLQQNIDRAFVNSGASARRSGADIAAYGQEMDRLRAKYSPLFAAQQQYRQQLEEINRAHRVGALGQAEYAAAIATTKTAFAGQVQLIRGTAEAVERGAVAYRRIGPIAQQAGYQVGDFFVQIASGTNPMVAFTQQFSQLAGFFGPIGAGLGALGAIAGALYLTFDRGRGSTAEATEAMEAYKRALEDSVDVSNDAVAASDRLAQSREREAIAAAEAALRVEEATMSQVRADIAAYQRDLEALRQGPNPNQTAIRQAESQIDSLTETFDAASDRAGVLFGQLSLLRDAFGKPIPPALSKEVASASKTSRTLSDVLADLNMEVDRLADKQTAEAVQDIGRVMEQSTTPAERYARQVESVELALAQVQLRIEQLRAMGDEGRASALEAAIGDPSKVRATLQRLDPAVKEVEDRTRRAADEYQQQFERATDRVADRFEEFSSSVIFDGLTGKAANAWDTFRDLGLRAISDLAGAILRANIFQPLANGFVSAVPGLFGLSGGPAGVGGAGGSALSAGSSLLNIGSGASSLWNAFSGGASSAFNSFALSSAGASLGLSASGSFAAGSMMAAEGGLFAAGAGATPGLTSIGSALSAAAPYALAAIAAITIATQLFKKKPSDFTASFQGMLSDDEFIQSEDKANGETRQMRDQIQGATETALKAVLGGLDLERPAGTYLDVAAGSRDGLRFWLYETLDSYANRPASERSDPIASGRFDTVEDLIGGVLEAVIARAGTAGLNEALKAVAENADFSDLEEALAEIELAKVYDQLGETAKATAEADSAIAEINARFDELTEFAEKFGLAVDKVDTGRADAFNDLATGFTQGLQDQIASIKDPAQLAIRELNAWRDATIANADAIAIANGKSGASAEDLALILEIFGLRLADITGAVIDATTGLTQTQAAIIGDQLRGVRAYLTELERTNETWRRTASTLRQARQSLLLDADLSPLSPRARLDDTRAQFEEVARLAQLGNQDALEQLPATSRAFLEASRAYYASSEQYYADFARVQGVLEMTEALAGRQADNSAAQLSAAQDQLARLEEMVSGQQLVVTSLAQANQLLAGIEAQLAEARGNLPAGANDNANLSAIARNVDAIFGTYRAVRDAAGGPTDELRAQRDAQIAAALAGLTLEQKKAVGDLLNTANLGMSSPDNPFRQVAGFATGGSFTIGGSAGVDNLTMPPVRVTAGEVANISRADVMRDVVAELRGLREENRRLNAAVDRLTAANAAGQQEQIDLLRVGNSNDRDMHREQRRARAARK